MAYIRSLPTDRAALEPKVAYLDFIIRQQNSVDFNAGLGYIELLSGDPEVREKQLADMVALKSQAERTITGPPIPDVFARLPETGPGSRTEVAAQIDAYFRSLPADPDDRRFVVAHMIELSPEGRFFFADFLRELTTVSAEEREERLDYLEYWNQEKRFAYRLGSPIFSLWFHVTDPAGMAVAHGCILVVIFLFAIGFCTRTTSVLTWLAAVGYIHRTQQVLFGMDTMMNILLIYLMIGNSGAAVSVDRLIARYRASKNALARSGTIDAVTRQYLDRPPPSVTANVAIRLLQVHFCFIYMASGMSKLKGGAWWNTTAYWDTLVNPEFTLIHFHWYETVIREMVQQRPVFAVVSALGVAFTFVAELGLPFLIWTRLRPWMVMLGLMLHAGIAVFMGLWIFSLFMMTMLLGYLPGSCIRERLFGTKPGPRVAYRFDRTSPTQVRAAAVARALDFDGQLDFAAGGAGTQVMPAKELMRSLTWTKSFAWVLGVPVVGGLLGRRLGPGA